MNRYKMHKKPALRGPGLSSQCDFLITLMHCHYLDASQSHDYNKLPQHGTLSVPVTMVNGAVFLSASGSGVNR